jgi:hypothetical protein
MGDTVRPEFDHWQGPSPYLEGIRKTLEDVTQDPPGDANWTIESSGLELHVLFDGTPHLVDRSFVLEGLKPVASTILIELGERATFELLNETRFGRTYRQFPDFFERKRQERREESST